MKRIEKQRSPCKSLVRIHCSLGSVPSQEILPNGRSVAAPASALWPALNYVKEQNEAVAKACTWVPRRGIAAAMVIATFKNKNKKIGALSTSLFCLLVDPVLCVGGGTVISPLKEVSPHLFCNRIRSPKSKEGGPVASYSVAGKSPPCIFGLSKSKAESSCCCLADDGFDPSTSWLWAQHASMAPLSWKGYSPPHPSGACGPAIL